MSQISRAVLGLLLVNIAVFVAGLVLPHGREQIIATGAFWYPANEHFGPWQAVT